MTSKAFMSKAGDGPFFLYHEAYNMIAALAESLSAFIVMETL